MPVPYNLETCGIGVYRGESPECQELIGELIDFFNLTPDGHYPESGEPEKDYYHYFPLLLAIKNKLKKHKNDIKDLEDRVKALEDA